MNLDGLDELLAGNELDWGDVGTAAADQRQQPLSVPGRLSRSTPEPSCGSVFAHRSLLCGFAGVLHASLGLDSSPREHAVDLDVE